MEKQDKNLLIIMFDKKYLAFSKSQDKIYWTYSLTAAKKFDSIYESCRYIRILFSEDKVDLKSFLFCEILNYEEQRSIKEGRRKNDSKNSCQSSGKKPKKRDAKQNGSNAK